MKYILLGLFLSFNISASELKLVGQSLLEFSIFKIDVYEISFYKSQSGIEEIHLDYKIHVEKKYSLTGWNKSLKHITTKNPKMQKKLNWILSNTSDYNKGDLVILRKEKNKVSLLKNQKLIAQTNDAQIASIIFEPWIGAKPINQKIKDKLLGNLYE